MIETILRPTGGSFNSTELELTLYTEPPDDIDESKYKFDTSPEYKIQCLKLFTKATPMCKNVEIFISDDFPLIVQYRVGDLGTLRFLLAPRFKDTQWDDEDEPSRTRIKSVSAIDSLRRPKMPKQFQVQSPGASEAAATLAIASLVDVAEMAETQSESLSGQTSGMVLE